MADPVQRMKLFVAEVQEQRRGETARDCSARRLPDLLPAVEAVVEVVCAGLLPEQFSGNVVSVRHDARRDRFPLVIAFGPRRTVRSDEVEIGASVLFRCEADGRLHGYRYPFHSLLKALEPKAFVDLGEPEAVTAEVLGNTVAEFLEWAVAGDGCGGRRLHFEEPTTLKFARPLVPRSGIAA